ncbi:hypothetical protein PO878_04075 [Iamia majanohamensis]|uniref:Uncharacterized protein n=1 Tax=Iamia majanohamensis TaxID=467976 RepID=A0AAF0BWJ7_9ACTN|nr:hypothetical protein [Iamia majanohamensis]WCO67900.1 hypothetical protein PO878_04075 [Iamia majanohamensis]
MSAPSTTRWRETERMVARWLRANGYPHAETTRNRERGSGRQSQLGDIDGVPGLVVEVKSHTSGTSWPSWARQAEAEAEGRPWVVIWRKPRETDVGQWPCLTSEAWPGSRWVAVSGRYGASGLLVPVADALADLPAPAEQGATP